MPPGWSNKTIDEANKTSRRRPRGRDAQDPQENAAVAVGIVYAQDPPAGAEVRRAARVTLTFNPGKSRSTWPTSSARTIADAKAALAGLGLVPQVDRGGAGPAGRRGRLAQDPPPGKVDREHGVKLTVVEGLGQVGVPNVANLDVVTATRSSPPPASVTQRAERASDRRRRQGDPHRPGRPAGGRQGHRPSRSSCRAAPPPVGVPMSTARPRPRPATSCRRAASRPGPTCRTCPSARRRPAR